jgi:hypothetical protein
MAGTFILLIGADTATKPEYVGWEVEIAIEEERRVIGVNLNGARDADLRCPPVLRDRGAIFVPFKAKAVAYALEHFDYRTRGDWVITGDKYRELGLITLADFFRRRV